MGKASILTGAVASVVAAMAGSALADGTAYVWNPSGGDGVTFNSPLNWTGTGGTGTITGYPSQNGDTTVYNTAGTFNITMAAITYIPLNETFNSGTYTLGTLVGGVPGTSTTRHSTASGTTISNNVVGTQTINYNWFAPSRTSGSVPTF